MERRITVKGTGKVSVKPDLIVLELGVDSLDMDYEKAMELAARSVENLNEVLAKADFVREELKTADFNVTAQYRSEPDTRGNYHQVFEGYAVHHGLKLEFDFEKNRLSKTLSAIAAAQVMPRLSIRFSMKDKTAADEELLTKATENARTKAEILARASGVQLGKLIQIDYNLKEDQLYSNTNYAMEDAMFMKSARLAPDIEPEDITQSNQAVFVWEII